MSVFGVSFIDVVLRREFVSLHVSYLVRHGVFHEVMVAVFYLFAKRGFLLFSIFEMLHNFVICNFFFLQFFRHVSTDMFVST